MKNWTIGRRLTAGFAGVLAVTTIVSAMTIANLMDISTDAAFVRDRSLPGVFNTARARGILKDGYAGVLRHVLAANAAERTAVEADLVRFGQEMDAVLKEYEKTIDTPEARGLYDALSAPIQEYRRIREQAILPLSRENKRDEAAAMIRSQLEPAFQRS